MKLEDIKQMAVIGSGTMGPGMGFCFARAGIGVRIYDISDEQVELAKARLEQIGGLFSSEGLLSPENTREALGRISLTTDLAEALNGAQFVLEAVPEKLELKHQVFKKLQQLCAPDAILATNTSGLSISEISRALDEPSRLVGLHWVNPPELVPLVEVIKGEHTPDETMDLTYELALKIGKQPIRVNQDIPGFAMNRLQFALFREALHLVESGALSAEDVDKAFRYGHGFRTSWQGPLETADLGGLDVFSSVASYLFRNLSSAQEPQPVLSELITDRKLGLKSGQGFFTWDEEAKKKVLKRDIYFARQGKLIEQVKND